MKRISTNRKLEEEVSLSTLHSDTYGKTSTE